MHSGKHSQQDGHNSKKPRHRRDSDEHPNLNVHSAKQDDTAHHLAEKPFEKVYSDARGPPEETGLVQPRAFQNPLANGHKNSDHVSIQMKEHTNHDNHSHHAPNDGAKRQMKRSSTFKALQSLRKPKNKPKSPALKIFCMILCFPLYLICWLAHKCRGKKEEFDDVVVPNTEGTQLECWDTCLICCAVCTCGASYCIVATLDNRR